MKIHSIGKYQHLLTMYIRWREQVSGSDRNMAVAKQNWSVAATVKWFNWVYINKTEDIISNNWYFICNLFYIQYKGIKIPLQTSFIMWLKCYLHPWSISVTVNLCCFNITVIFNVFSNAQTNSHITKTQRETCLN